MIEAKDSTGKTVARVTKSDYLPGSIQEKRALEFFIMRYLLANHLHYARLTIVGTYNEAESHDYAILDDRLIIV